MPENDDLSIDAARKILKINFSKIDHERMAVLSTKASAGELNSDEEKEMDSFLRSGDLLAILQSKARAVLKRAGLDS